MNRDIDSAKRVHTLKTLFWSLPGGLIGAAVGLYGAYEGRWSALVGIIAGFLIAGLIVFVVATVVSRGTATLAGSVLLPSGKSTPAQREYSYPQSLAARGRYEEAITAFQVCCLDHPEDPEPYVRIARIYRDHLRSYDDALFWFKRARSESTLSPRYEMLITQEIIEVHTCKAGNPQKAIPELARMVDRFPDDPASDWARTEIRRLRGITPT